MSKTESVQKEMIAAMKAKDKEKKESLTLLLSALKANRHKERECGRRFQLSVGHTLHQSVAFRFKLGFYGHNFF